MKKLLIGLLTFISFEIVKANSININDIDTNTYIIGYQVFELNNYDISIYDVSSAIAEYTSINSTNDSDLPIYFYSKDKNGNKKIEQIIGGINGKTKVPVKVFNNIKEVFINNILEVTSINGNKINNDLDIDNIINDLDIDNIINDLVIELNNQDGFKNISYSNNNLSITITDKIAAALNSSIVLGNIYKKYSSIIGNSNIIYTITLPDSIVLTGTYDNKLNSLLKLLNDVRKHLPNKNNSVSINLKINSINKNYILVVNKEYVN